MTTTDTGDVPEGGPDPQVIGAPPVEDSPPPLAKAIATPQFWLVVVTSIISILVGIGDLGPDFAKKHEELVNAIAMLAAVLGPAIYAVARAISVHGHQQAQATVLAARAAALPALVIGAPPAPRSVVEIHHHTPDAPAPVAKKATAPRTTSSRGR